MSISTAISASAVARVLGIQTLFKNLRGSNTALLPQRVGLIGQGATASNSAYSLDATQVFSAVEVGQTYGFGSPLHLAAKQLLPENNDGIGSIPLVIYPLKDHASGVASTGKIVPSGTQTQTAEYVVKMNNIPSASFTITAGEIGTGLEARIADAISANVDMPMLASADTGNNEIDLTSKWKGASANDIKVEVVGPSYGITFAVTQPSAGATNPSVSGPLALVGNVWVTMILNCLEIADTTALGLYQTFGDSRWGALVRKPLVVFTGNNATSVASATAVSDARKTDKVNAQLVSPGSKDLPFVIAARQLSRIVVLADNNPPHDYGSQQATGLVPGADGDQWDFAMRDAAVKAGSSTVEVKDGVVCISDVVTFYHPSGDPTPAYRFVVDIVKLQNIIFNLDLTFNTPEWDGAPLVPDSSPTNNPTAKKPKSAKTAIAAVVDGLGLAAIISDPETAKASIQTGINGSNPKRLDASLTVQLSGNTNQIAVDLNFGFFFGG